MADQLAGDLIERFQRDFPIVRRPYAEIARRLDRSEVEVVAVLMGLLDQGRLTRIGPVVRPNVAGCSTLAAIAVPPERLDAVARQVSSEAGVNHNYEREGRINLWFVVHARDEADLTETLSRISRRAGLPVYDFRLETEYKINLGFSLLDTKSPETAPQPPGDVPACSTDDVALIAALDAGLGLEPEPFGQVAGRIGTDVDACLAQIRNLIERGVIRRFGLVLRHRAFGYDANAMAVWQVPVGDIDRIGRALAAEKGVNLCYRRRTALADWPFNLYAMIHGKDRAAVEARIGEIASAQGLSGFESRILFSTRCFKQTGARHRKVAA